MADADELCSVEQSADPSAEPEPRAARVSGRDHAGRFATGNTFRLRHGRWSRAVAKALLPQQAELLAMLGDREAAILVDLGGDSELSTFERDAVRTYLQLDAVKEYNAPLMLRSRASARKAAIDAFMACVDRQLKIIGQLGLQRRSKQIVESPAEWAARVVAERAAEAKREHTDDAEQSDEQTDAPTECGR